MGATTTRAAGLKHRRLNAQGLIRDRVVAHVASDFSLDARDLMSPTRGAPRTALARQVAMYLAHTAFGLNFRTIGRAFGRDRTTVAHACRMIEDGRDDDWFDSRLSALELTCRTQPHPLRVRRQEGA